MIFALSASCILHLMIFSLPTPFDFGKPHALPEGHTASRPFNASMTVSKLAADPSPPEKAVQQKRVSSESVASAVKQKIQSPQGPELADKPIDSIDSIEDRYFPIEELSQEPQVQGEVKLDTPETRAIIAAGIIVLRLWINENGNVDRLVVEKTNLPEPIVTLATNAFLDTHFIPGQRDHQPVKSMISFEIVFDDERIQEY